MIPLSKRTQTNTAGVSSKDRSSSGPRPDGGAGGELPVFEGWVPVGGIVMYSGLFADLPDNWKLCDGTLGTPNLTDRFILATATEAEVTTPTTGGAKKHRHNLIAADTPAGTATVVAITAGTPAGTVGNSSPGGTMNAHTTTAVQSGAGTTVVTGPASHTVSVDAHSHSFTGDALVAHTHLLAGKTALGESEAGAYGTNDTLPPFYKLAFIQRIS